MHFDFFTEHKNNRVQKIISIYGSDWFKGKSILELGACHGDIGIEFIKLGAEVTFCDIREENLNEIINSLRQNRPSKAKPDCIKSVYLSSTMGGSYQIDSKSFNL